MRHLSRTVAAIAAAAVATGIGLLPMSSAAAAPAPARTAAAADTWYTQDLPSATPFSLGQTVRLTATANSDVPVGFVVWYRAAGEPTWHAVHSDAHVLISYYGTTVNVDWTPGADENGRVVKVGWLRTGDPTRTTHWSSETQLQRTNPPPPVDPTPPVDPSPAFTRDLEPSYSYKWGEKLEMKVVRPDSSFPVTWVVYWKRGDSGWRDLVSDDHVEVITAVNGVIIKWSGSASENGTSIRIGYQLETSPTITHWSATTTLRFQPLTPAEAWISPISATWNSPIHEPGAQLQVQAQARVAPIPYVCDEGGIVCYRKRSVVFYVQTRPLWGGAWTTLNVPVSPETGLRIDTVDPTFTWAMRAPVNKSQIRLGWEFVTVWGTTVPTDQWQVRDSGINWTLPVTL